MQVASTSSAVPPVSTIPSVFETVQGYKVPVFFSRYPAGISIAAQEVEDALRKIDEEASEEGTRERRRALIRHTNPYGDPFAVCHCSAFPDRLILLSCLIEVMWIHDGERSICPTDLLYANGTIYRRDRGDGSCLCKSTRSPYIDNHLTIYRHAESMMSWQRSFNLTLIHRCSSLGMCDKGRWQSCFERQLTSILSKLLL
jgi:hypothetical protein